MDADKTVEKIAAELRKGAKRERATHEKGYHKSDLEFIGADAAAIHRAAKTFARAHKEVARTELLSVANALWSTRIHELRSVALLVMVELSTKIERRDLPSLRRWVVEADGWALVDTVGCWLLPRLIAQDDRVLTVMDKWATDKNFWVRRAAMLSLLAPLRRGDLDQWPRFVSYSEPQLEDKEFFVRKCIGWVLREVSKKAPGVVFDYLFRNRDRVSGLTLREGAKYLPAAVRKKLGLS